MSFSFEVRETDLMGRVGLLRVGGKVLETPYLFPVIHPVNQAVTPRELESMGFRGLMTNSYIIRSRRRQEALEKGIHRMLDYDGVLMTDSGGFQALEYGDLAVDYSEMAAFQAEIGSELAVTLDRPTGFSGSERYARGTMEYSLKNAVSTMKEFGERKTVWVGPVQGGLFPGLLRKSASSLVEAGFEFLALGSPVQIMENYRFSELARMIIVTRGAVPYSVPLHLFGAGHPLTMALAVALGCDTFDSASYILFAREGRYMTERGVSRLQGMKFLPCSCPVCTRTTAKELMELEPRERGRSLATHNLHVLRKELESCKEAIAEGRLWDLVQEKAAVHPRLYEALAEVAKAGDTLKEGTPPLKERGLLLRNAYDSRRPELALAREKLRQATSRGSETAVLLTVRESAPLAKLGIASELPEDADLYKLHPILGPYPVELEFVYPFTQTVSSSKRSGLRKNREAVEKLRELGYSKILVATTDANGFLRVADAMNRRRSKGSSPSVPSSSARPRLLRHP
jgi:7-cyano-7-deazaguanine tRNA-ribosyltransferase